MRILVTGGAGFIGSHLTDALCISGHNVHVLDNLSAGTPKHVPPGVPLHVHDVRSSEAAARMADHKYDVLVHHAAQMDVRASVRDPRRDAEINIRGFLNLMEAGRENGLKVVLFASTGGAIYGEPAYAPQDETHPVRPLSPYGVAKLTVEKYLGYYRAQYGIRSVCLRYANVYGPRQRADGEGGVVAIFARQLLSGGVPVIFGDGKQTRDYVYVDDVVRANLAALAFGGSGTFNIGTGQETSVNILFRLLRSRTGTSCEERHASGKQGEQRRSVLDAERAAHNLNWTPQVPLETGLTRTVCWFRSRLSKASVAPVAS